MIAEANTFTINGIEALPVRVECWIGNGLPAFEIVGLASTAVREARERVRSAIRSSGLQFPNRKIIVSLAPADVRKEGSHFDLAIAAAVLMASGQISGGERGACYLAGELSLNGQLRGVPGVLPMALALAGGQPPAKLLVPADNRHEAGIPGDLRVYAFDSLRQVAAFYNGTFVQTWHEEQEWQGKPGFIAELDYADTRGQESAKRALQVAAAGFHNLLMIGPPGAGKTMLARRLPTIMPAMSRREVLETTRIYSCAGLLNSHCPVICERPFRSPHKNASTASMVGGGSIPRPGEISLAQNGVLFMDEMPEFARDVLEALRQPLEDRMVCIARSRAVYRFPCRFVLVASMNPCPCGMYGSEFECRCSPREIQKYMSRISGPLLERLDLQIEIGRVDYEHLTGRQQGRNSAELRDQVINAREIQERRFAESHTTHNSEMDSADLRRYCQLPDDAEILLKNTFNLLGFSARAYEQVLKLARTVADLESADIINASHISEAIQYRSLDRKYWRQSG